LAAIPPPAPEPMMTTSWTVRLRMICIEDLDLPAAVGTFS
jgi:hypothetical protein